MEKTCGNVSHHFTTYNNKTTDLTWSTNAHNCFTIYTLIIVQGFVGLFPADIATLDTDSLPDGVGDGWGRISG